MSHFTAPEQYQGRLAVAPAVPISAASRKKIWWQAGLLATALLFLWLEVVKHLSGEWSLNPQYSYGWAVPFLAIFLLWQRWPERPSPQPPIWRTLPIGLILVCAFLFLPVRFVAEANPDWRFLSWALALVAVAVSLGFVFLAGGFPWARHFAFPFLFFLVAVPWPVRFEEIVIQDLMRAVTAINVTLLNIAGVPALQHGNVIEVTSGLIGIEEACSGVRSLQATLMISLFLGDLYSFTIGRRVFLVLAGGILAFASNLVRTAILVWVGASRGPSSIEGWHDPAGLTILLVCLFGLWSISLIMQRRSNATLPSASLEARPAELPPRQAGRSMHLPWPLMAAVAIWVLFAEIGVQVWYGLHQLPASSRWLVSWPVSAPGYKTAPIAPEAETLLRYNEGGGASWDGSEGRHWFMYFFRWLPGRTAARFVKVHRPDVCLPAAGLTMTKDSGVRLLAVNGVNLPIRSYRFDGGGSPLHVFYCYWDARSSYENAKSAEQEDWTPKGRWRAALSGRREMGAQMLELVVAGHENDDEADAALQRQLTQIIRPD